MVDVTSPFFIENRMCSPVCSTGCCKKQKKPPHANADDTRVARSSTLMVDKQQIFVGKTKV
jgi:hypothetical protein